MRCSFKHEPGKYIYVSRDAPLKRKSAASWALLSCKLCKPLRFRREWNDDVRSVQAEADRAPLDLYISSPSVPHSSLTDANDLFSLVWRTSCPRLGLQVTSVSSGPRRLRPRLTVCRASSALNGERKTHIELPRGEHGAQNCGHDSHQSGIELI